MKRTLIIVLALLAVANIAWRVYAGWGLVTIDEENAPLSKVAASIARQGKVQLETNLDPATKVTMHVRKVPLTDALETLATVTDSRWRLMYLLAPDKGALQTARQGLRSAEPIAGWRQISYPMPSLTEFPDDAPPDPRRDQWNVKPQPEATLQAYAEHAARTGDVAIALPETWNPPVGKAPASGELHSAVPRLAKAAGGQAEEIFVLSKSNRNRWSGREEQNTPNAASDGAPTQPRSWTARSPEEQEKRTAAYQERMQAEVDRLPPEKRAEAQARLDQARAFWTQLRELPEAERRARIMEFMSDPSRQGQMEERMASQDQRRTPEQRVDRYRQYVGRKEQAKQKAQQP